MKVAPHESCRVCGSSVSVPYGEKNGIDFEKCVHCGYIVASPMVSQEELAALYDAEHFHSSYHPEESSDRALFEQRKEQYVLDRDLLMRFATSGRLLDYGCGNGHFLRTFPEAFDKYGYEFNRATTSYLKEQAAFGVLDTEDELREKEDGFFDVIMMRGVIEHLTDPLATLELLASKLRDGGLLYVCATPNADSPCALLYGTSWNQFTPPYHLHHFSPRTLGLVGARSGLAMIECQFPYLGTPYEQQREDGERFVLDARAGFEGSFDTSPPFPGTMMSLVFRMHRAHFRA